MKNKNKLKQYRTDAHIGLKDVATLLNSDSGNLTRYENGKRPPTSEILLTYHILFGIPIVELIKPLYIKVKRNIITRSKRLLPELIAKQTTKSKQSLAYITSVVNSLIQESYDEQE